MISKADQELIIIFENTLNYYLKKRIKKNADVFDLIKAYGRIFSKKKSLYTKSLLIKFCNFITIYNAYFDKYTIADFRLIEVIQLKRIILPYKILKHLIDLSYNYNISGNFLRLHLKYLDRLFTEKALVRGINNSYSRYTSKEEKFIKSKLAKWAELCLTSYEAIICLGIPRSSKFWIYYLDNVPNEKISDILDTLISRINSVCPSIKITKELYLYFMKRLGSIQKLYILENINLEHVPKKYRPFHYCVISKIIDKEQIKNIYLKNSELNFLLTYPDDRVRKFLC